MRSISEVEIQDVHGGAALGKAIGMVVGGIIGAALVAAAEIPTGGAATAGIIGVVGTCAGIGGSIGEAL